MTDAQTALAQVREALAKGPTDGEWSTNGAVVLLPGGGGFDMYRLPSAYSNARYIAACNPVNMAAILAHVESQAAEFERLTFDNEQLRDMLARLYAGTDLYSDDGELQDARAEPFIDFKRDSAADIRCAMVERGEQR